MKEAADIVVGLGVIFNSIVLLVAYWKAAHVVKTVDLLEKNTNSIKDALVKVTGEAEHAKGVIEGKKEEANK